MSDQEDMEKDMALIERLMREINALLRPKVEAIVRPKVAAGWRAVYRDGQLEEQRNIIAFMSKPDRRKHDRLWRAYQRSVKAGPVQDAAPTADRLEYNVAWNLDRDVHLLFLAWQCICVWWSGEGKSYPVPGTNPPVSIPKWTPEPTDDLVAKLGDDLLPPHHPVRDEVFSHELGFTLLTVEEALEILRQLRREAGDAVPLAMGMWLGRYRPAAKP